MALKLNFCSLSFGASVDQQTGHLSVFDIIDELKVPQVPIALQSCVISIALGKSDTSPFTGKILIHIITPGGQQQMVGSGDLKIPAEQKKMKAVFRFGGFPIHTFGAHRFVLSWVNEAGTKVGEGLIDFDVIQVTQVAQGATPSEMPAVQH